MTLLQVKVRPNARTSTLEPSRSGPWIASLKSAPIEGRANDELIALIARHFGCPRSAVTIKGGTTGRTKWVKVEA